MPEGLDNAARAFQTEIAPQSSRPRDEGGRFTAQPETMFAPRPLEGDPVTGDTRDAGDDARLAAMERRVADGRAEEGDEEFAARSGQAAARQGRQGRERLQAGDEGARHAPADQGHERAEAEPGERTDEELGDQDAQERDEREDGEGTSEQDAESQFKITTLDGKPVEKFEVQVDGQPLEVSLDEALRGYVREKTFHQRMNKVAEARQAVEGEAAQTAQIRQHYIQQCEHLARVLTEVLPPQPNWDEEFQRDPRAAHERQKAYAAIYGKVNELNQQAQAAEAQARQEYDRKSQAYAVDQFSQFVKEANIPDEKALNERLTRMRAYGRRMGFTEGELATVYDKRMLRVLDHAAKYDQGQRNLPKPVIPGKGKTLTPGVATPAGNATRRSLDEAQQRLAKTGRLDDAASVFQRLIR
jgi:hypothetical protein